MGDGIIVDWEQSPMAGLIENSHGDFDKEHYLDLVDPIVALVTGCLAEIRQALQKWLSGASIEANFLSETKSARQQISDAYDALANSPEAPYECHDLDAPVGRMLAYAHNIVLYHNERGIELWTAQVRRQMTASALDNASKCLKRIEYEREKIL